MRVGVPRQYLVVDEPFDEVERPAGRRVVGIGHPPGPVRSPHDLVITNDRISGAAQKWAVGRLNVAVHRPIIDSCSASTLSWFFRSVAHAVRWRGGALFNVSSGGCKRAKLDKID